MKTKHKWLNITYPSILTHFLKVWENTFCKVGFHLFDEVYSSGWDFGQHYLICDACELTIIIDDDVEHSHKFQLEKED